MSQLSTEHKARDEWLKPSSPISKEVKEIAEILWQFHNDRLDDPSIKEMHPYIQPILDLITTETTKAKQEGAELVLATLPQLELRKVIKRAEKIVDLLPPLRELEKLGKRRRKSIYADYIDEDSIKAELSQERKQQ